MGFLEARMPRLRAAALAPLSPFRRPTVRARTALCCIPVVFILSGCVNIAGDACVDPDTAAGVAVANNRDVAPRNCDGSFLSARNQRSVLYTGEDSPRLWTGEGPRTGGGIDTSRVNAPPPRIPDQPITGYLGSLRVDYEPDASAIEADVKELRVSNGRKPFDPNAPVTVDFKKATIDHILKQLLGGALGLNYVAPDDLGGSVTFRTETPVPKSQLLQIVRDLLARNGLSIKNLNGVYHVGSPDFIAGVENTSSSGQSGDRVTRLIRIRKGNGPDFINVVRQLVPPDVTIQPTNSANAIIVRASPSDIDQLETMLKRLSANDLGEDRVAIIPLQQSAPDRIANQVAQFYRARGVEGLTVLPLEKQQALLVGSRDPVVMSGIRGLVRAMDSEARDEVALRIIPLQHISAEEIAQKLAAIFGGSGGGASASPPIYGSRSGAGSRFARGQGQSGGDQNGASDSSRESPRVLPPVRQTAPASSVDDDDGGGSGGAAPGFSMGRAGRSTPRSGGFGGSSAGGEAFGGGGGGAGSGAGEQQVKIAAEARSNSVMVYSTYALFKRVQEVLRALDVPQAQVVIEATVVEVELTDRLQQGVQFFLQGRGFSVASGSTGSTIPQPTQGGTIGIGASLGTVRVDAVLEALQSVTKVKVISSPYLTVLDGKQARLVIGDQIPYAKRTQSSNNTGNVTVTQEIEVKDTGIILDVTPKINSNNSVVLKVNQQVSTPSQSVQSGNTTPVIATRNVESDILLQSGRTVLLAGLIQDRLEQQDGGVPVLRTVPILGDLFKTKQDNVRRVELIVMITPRVARQAAQIENLARLLQAQIHTR